MKSSVNAVILPLCLRHAVTKLCGSCRCYE